MSVNPIPKNCHSVTPYLAVEGVPRLIEFLKNVFHAVEIERHNDPKGRIMHAEVRIGDSVVMMGEAMEAFPAMPSCLYVYLPDVEAVYKAALTAGGESLQEPADQFYGDRTAAVRDPSGNKWWIATHIEDVSREEMDRRMRAMMQKA